MPPNPFARDPAVTVGVGGDASGLNGALDGAVAKLSSFRGAVAATGAALGALAVGGLAAATKAAADFEESMVEVEKVTDPETAEAMAGSIREMASEMPVAQDELAGIAAQAGRFGVEGVENMEAFTRSVSKMSVATDLSTEEAGEAFARMTTLLDEPIGEVENLGSAVNELSNTMATSSSEITNAATRSAGALSQLGVGSEDVLALNAAMNEVSASSRIAGTRLRRMAQEIQDPGKTEDFADALGMSVDAFEEMREESPGQLIEELAESFAEGDQQADALRDTLSTTSRAALAGLSENLDSLSDAQEASNEQMEEGTSLEKEFEAASDTFNSRLQITKNRIRNIGLQIGERLLPVATKLLDRINGAIETFSAWNEETDGMLGVTTLTTAAIAGLGVAVATAGSLLSGVVATIATIAAPLLAVAAAAGLLAAAWRSNFLGIRDITFRVLDLVKQGLQRSLDTIMTVWEIHGEDLVAETKMTMDAIWAKIQPALQLISEFWELHGDRIMSAARNSFEMIHTIIEGTLDGIISLIRVGLALMRGDWSGALDILRGLADRQWGRIQEVVGLYIENVRTLTEGLGTWIKETAVGLFRRAFSAVATAIMNPLQPVIDTLETIVNTAERAIDAASSVSGVDVPNVGGGSKATSKFRSAIPGLDTGGFIQEDGAAMLHAGERVVPAASVDRDGGGGGGGDQIVIEEIHASGREEGRAAGKALHSELKGQGIGR